MSGKRKRQRDALQANVSGIAIPAEAESKWSELVVICEECSQKRSKQGVDGEGTSLLHWLKRRLREDGRRKEFRVVECSCLDICPKHGIAIARGSELARGKGLRVLEADDKPESVTAWLYAHASAND